MYLSAVFFLVSFCLKAGPFCMILIESAFLLFNCGTNVIRLWIKGVSTLFEFILLPQGVGDGVYNINCIKAIAIEEFFSWHHESGTILISP